MDSPIVPSAIASPEVQPPATPPADQNAAPSQAQAKRAPGQHKDGCKCRLCERIAQKKTQGGQVVFRKAGEASGTSLKPNLSPSGKPSEPTNTSSISIAQKVAAMRAEQSQAAAQPTKESKLDENQPATARPLTWWDALKNPLAL